MEISLPSVLGGYRLVSNIVVGVAVNLALSLLFKPRLPNQTQGKISDLRLSSASYGQNIAQVWGKHRVGGNILWAGNYKDGQRVPSGTVGALHLRESSSASGGGKGKPKTTTFIYHASLAIAVCRGPAIALKRIWAEDIIIWDNGNTKYDITVHLGTNAQARTRQFSPLKEQGTQRPTEIFATSPLTT